jgi:hypothetical protein
VYKRQGQKLIDRLQAHAGLTFRVE